MSSPNSSTSSNNPGGGRRKGVLPLLLPDWSQLSTEMLTEISKNLSLRDFIRFRSVCRPWRSAVYLHDLPPQLPWLLLPYDASEGISRFLSLSDQRVFHLRLHETRGKRCCGSSHGWLVMVDLSLEISLLNPLTRVQIQLPPLTTLPLLVCLKGFDDRFVHKVILSSNPALGADCVVIALLSVFRKLVSCRVGDESWTVIDFDESLGIIADGAYYKGQFYVLGYNNKVEVCNVGPSAKTLRIQSLEITVQSRVYLVVSAGRLLLVNQHMHNDRLVDRLSFRVYNLDLNGSGEAFEVKTICDSMLFVCNVQSLSASASDLRQRRGNCIYFTDAYYGYWDEYDNDGLGYNNIGVFYLEDDSFERLPWNFELDLDHQEEPKWVTPSFC